MTSLFRITLLLLAAAALPARGAEPESGGLTRAPAVVEPATPEYPQAASAAGLSAEVFLELDLSAEGGVIGARVTRPAGQGFDEAALAAARKLRFSPAEIDGKPAAVTVEYRFRFEAPPPPPPAAALATLRGVALERGTRLPVAGVEVSAGEARAFTDREGRFELPGLAPGPRAVVLGDPAYHRYETEETLVAGQATEVRYYLRRAHDNPYEAVIVGDREKKEVTTVTITSGELSRVAGVSGDTVKVVQNLPGVARAPGGFGMLVVRGGNPGDTRVYVDGVEVPMVFHFGGLTSVVPSEFVESVDFEAGNFGARYGRATGGRVDLRTRDPGKRLHLVTDANLYHALAMVEGPAREDLAVAFGVRRSYADAVIRQAAERSGEIGVSVAPRYYDYQGRLAWRPGPDDVVRLSVFGSDDRMTFTGVEAEGSLQKDSLAYGTAFVQAAASWEHRFSEAARSRIAVAQGYFDVNARMGSVGSERDQVHMTTLRAEASRLFGEGEALRLSAGVDARFVPRARLQLSWPAIPPPNQLPDPRAPQIRTHMKLSGMEGGLWAEAEWRPADALALTAGLRADRFDMLSEMSWLDPRLSARWSPWGGTTLKGAAGLYHQTNLQLAYMTEEWGNPDLKEEGAWHFMAGVEQRIAGPVTLDLQLYRKRLFDLVLPTNATTVRNGQVVPERYVNAGTGSSTGVELLLRWNPGGRFFGWLSYSYSRSVRDQKVVGGTLEPGGDAFDQPHNLTALGTVELPDVWDGLSAGFRLRWTTGNPYRRALLGVFDADGDVHQPVWEQVAASRTPDFLQLDLRVDKRWTWKTWMLSAYLEVQNATNRKNPETIAYNYDYSRQGWMSSLPLFPSFGVRAEY